MNKLRKSKKMQPTKLKGRLKSTRVFVATGLLALSANFASAQALRDHVPSGKYIGNILNYQFFEVPEQNPADYESLVRSQFNGIVAENNFKMDKILSNRPADPFNIQLSEINTRFIDQMVDWADADKNGKTIKRGHALIWFSQAPQWLKNDARNWSKDEIYQFSKSYIQLVIGYTNGKVEEWDVVNEAINTSSSGFRDGGDIWYRNVEDIQSYIEHCFTAAREADPNETTKLFYNDFSIEEYQNNTNTKNRFMIDMVQKMVSKNVPIDAVGLQGHFIQSKVNKGFVDRVERTIDIVNDMGLICNITELDIRICDAGGNLAQKMEEQKETYKQIVEMALSKELSTGLLIWGFSDRHSWVSSVFGNCDDALIYDDNYDKKPAYDGVLEALKSLTSGSVKGGVLTGGPFTFTVGDGIADNVSGVSVSGNEGSNSQWVVTDDKNTILGLPGSPEAVNFDEAAPGVCLIWHLSHEDDLTGAVVGNNVSALEGTFSLSNSITVTRNAVVVPPTGVDCDFGTPVSEPIATTYGYYNYAHVLGGKGPDLSTISGFAITWDARNNGLWHIALQTSNGIPSYYVNLLDKVEYTLGQAQPEITFEGTGVAGFDGSYYIAKDGENFVLVSKTSGFTVYFSNSSTEPDCDNGQGLKQGDLGIDLSVSPNPATDIVRISGTEDLNSGKITLFSLTGQELKSIDMSTSANREFDLSSLSSGLYLVKVFTDNGTNTARVVKK